MVAYKKYQGSTLAGPKGKKQKVNGILEIDFQNGLILYVYEGLLSKNDILIKFKDSKLPKTKERQPKHIHWAVDILIKKEHNAKLTDEFLRDMLGLWDKIQPLRNREYDTLLGHLTNSRNVDFIDKFKDLDNHGFFPMEFIIHLIELLMIQEKTNYADAYMFKGVVHKLLQSKDLYVIISKATYNKK